MVNSAQSACLECNLVRRNTANFGPFNSTYAFHVLWKYVYVTHILLLKPVLASLGSCYGAGVLPDGLLLGKVGGNVTFNRASDQPFLTLQMRVNSTTILNYISSSDTFKPEDAYRDRINLDRLSGSVELMNLVLTDSGQYTVTILTPEAVSVEENTKLEVYGKMFCILLLSVNTFPSMF